MAWSDAARAAAAAARKRHGVGKGNMTQSQHDAFHREMRSIRKRFKVSSQVPPFKGRK